jgi:hypothetical protein
MYKKILKMKNIQNFKNTCQNIKLLFKMYEKKSMALGISHKNINNIFYFFVTIKNKIILMQVFLMK